MTNADRTIDIENQINLANQIKKISNISKKLNETIQQRRAFEEQLITALSDIVCSFISKGTINCMPEEFQVLTQKADDYMLYQAETEEDQDFLIDCIRIYQITNMVKRSNIENKYRIATTKQNAEQYRKYYKILREINLCPGIAHEYLCERTGHSPSNLSYIIKKLEKYRLLFSRREGKTKYYMLTSIGLKILNKLTV